MKSVHEHKMKIILIRIAVLWACFLIISITAKVAKEKRDSYSETLDEDQQDDNLPFGEKMMEVEAQPEGENAGVEEDQSAISAGDFGSFLEWKKWPIEYPTCDPKQNKYLSPVNIDTKVAMITKEHTLFVFSDPPPKNLYRLEYTLEDLKNGNATFSLDVLAISSGIDDSRLLQATFISGLGDDNYRFFRNALILFGKKDTDYGPKRSFHQIDGKKFPMEIVMVFADKPQDLLSDTTQIHVMVKATDVDNPVFYPILSAVSHHLKSYINKEESNVMETRLFTAEYFNHKKELEEFHQIEKVDTNGGTYEWKILEKENEISELGDSEEQYKTFKDEVATALNETIKLAVELKDIEVSRTDLAGKKASNEATYQARVEGQEIEMGEETEETANIEALKEDLNKQTAYWNAVVRRSNEVAIQKEQSEINLNKVKRKLQSFGWSENPEENKYMPQEDREKELQRFKDLNEEKMLMERIFAEDEKRYKALQTQFGEVIIDLPFQISWLLPNTGGYYAYNGSYPVPPCRKREFVIVMKNPITISHEQLSLLQTSYKDPAIIDLVEHDPLDITVPVIFPLGNRKIWYNRKNLQFIRDDGVHMISTQRKKMKDAKYDAIASASAFAINKRIFVFVIVLSLVQKFSILKM